MAEIQEYRITQSLKAKLKNDTEKFKDKKILIIGDVGVDEYILGEVKRISPEAPVPVVEVQSEEKKLGLAANVAQNILSLGGKPYLISVIGEDQGAHILEDLFKSQNISTDYLIKDPSRSTTRKARVMAKHHHVVRVDYETRQFLHEKTQSQLFLQIDALISQVDGVILEDYAKGVATPDVINYLYTAAKKYSKPVFVDPHRNHQAPYYKGCDLIKPNYDEAIALLGMDADDLRQDPFKIQKIGKKLKDQTLAKHVVLTQGKEGMTIFNEKDQIVRVPTFAKNVFDVTGAGDTVIATLALAQSSGINLEESCVLANFAAGVVVAQVGCVPCSISELNQAINEFE